MHEELLFLPKEITPEDRATELHTQSGKDVFVFELDHQTYRCRVERDGLRVEEICNAAFEQIEAIKKVGANHHGWNYLIRLSTLPCGASIELLITPDVLVSKTKFRKTLLNKKIFFSGTQKDLEMILIRFFESSSFKRSTPFVSG